MANTLTESWPRSTIVVATAFWAVLVALMGWVLLGVSDLKQANARNSSDREHDVMALQEVRENVQDHEQRIRVLERPAEVRR